MRAYFKLMMVLVVVGILLAGYALLATGQKKTALSEGVESKEPSGQETYVSEVIIQAPWGEKNLYKWAGGEESKPGEFGHYVSRETELGPNTFTVAPNGDIYINDQLNKRIQRFGPNGDFISVIPVSAGNLMCVDKDNNIYAVVNLKRRLLGINKYDQAGNLLKSYPIGTERKSLLNIFCDNSGRVFMEFLYSITRVEKGKEISIDWNGISQVGNSARAFSLEEQKSLTRKDAYLGSNSAALDKDLLFHEDHGLAWNGYGNLYLVSFAGDTVRVLKSLRGFLLGCDESLNVYTHQYDEKKHERVVRKYNSKGELISTFQYWCGKPYTGIYTLRGCAFLDSKGNVYVFCESYKDGIKVTKWYKSE